MEYYRLLLHLNVHRKLCLHSGVIVVIIIIVITHIIHQNLYVFQIFTVTGFIRDIIEASDYVNPLK